LILSYLHKGYQFVMIRLLLMMKASRKPVQILLVIWHSIIGCIHQMEKHLSNHTKTIFGHSVGQKSVQVTSQPSAQIQMQEPSQIQLNDVANSVNSTGTVVSTHLFYPWFVHVVFFLMLWISV